MQLLESTQEARTEARRARERFQDLLSLPSRHRERTRTVHNAEREKLVALSVTLEIGTINKPISSVACAPMYLQMRSVLK